MIYGPDVYALHDPSEGGQHLDRFPWQLALETLDDPVLFAAGQDHDA